MIKFSATGFAAAAAAAAAVSQPASAYPPIQLGDFSPPFVVGDGESSNGFEQTPSTSGER